MPSGGLAALAAYRQFILYRLEPGLNGRVEKIPVSPHTLHDHDAHDASQWVDHDTALTTALALGTGWGAGFVLTAADPFFCLDLDHCRTANGWSDAAASVADMLPGAAIEISQSGESLHFWGVTPGLDHRTRPDPDAKCPWPGVELYTKRRFIALTGNIIAGDASTPCDLRPIVDTWFKPQPRVAVAEDAWNLEPVAHWRGPADDDELIRRALLSRSANSVWGAGVTFADLWTGNADALSKRWPADAAKATAWNESAADAALAAHLAFWTGRHHQRIAELMFRSALVRPKWERDDYVTRTVRLACAEGKEVLQDAPVAAPPVAPALVPQPPADPAALSAVPEAVANPVPPSGDSLSLPTIDGSAITGALPSGGGTPIVTLKQGRTILGAAEQHELFVGCVYVRRANRIYVPGVPYTLKREQFDATYGGRQFITADGKMSKSPWEAFTQNSNLEFPRVDDEDFNPHRAAGQVYRNDLQEWVVNTYLAPEIDAVAGDVSLWWEHLGHFFPQQSDRDTFMAWVSALVRYPGRKFSWSPLLVSGEGTGKTIVYDAIRAAMGQRYTRSVRGQSLTGRFNDWIGTTLLCVVEDFRLPKAADRDDLLEKLKEMVGGGERIEAEGKGRDAVNVRNICNFIFSANRLDVLRLDENSRRWAPFVLGLWSESQLKGRGMDNRYFVRLREWLKLPSTASALRHLFLTWDIPDHLNPVTYCTRAPRTTTGDEMFRANADPATQLIEDAVVAGQWGLRDGWATPDAVKVVLEKEKMQITTVGAGRLLERLGYIAHPALKDGWTLQTVPPHNRKLKLYIHTSSRYCHAHLSAAEVQRAYQAAQESAFEFVPSFGTSELIAGMLQ